MGRMQLACTKRGIVNMLNHDDCVPECRLGEWTKIDD
jgi:hypothetical protein